MTLARAYEQIGDALRAGIIDGRLRPGTVLLEGPLARLFGASRSPVKQALDILVQEGLVSPFDGRGLIVGDGRASVRRVPLDPAQFGEDFDGVTKAWAWQALYAEVERTLTLRCILGRWQVNEAELAAHYDIGRTVAHDVLIRIQATGIITKDSRARWITVPLDDKRVRDLYALRELLEPPAVAGAVGRVTPEALRAMLARLDAAAAAYPNVPASAFDKLENDLHVDVVGHAANRELPEALLRTRCIIISSKHLLGSVAALPATDPFLEEHRQVLEALARGNAKTAAGAMLAHLRSARAKVLDRLRVARGTDQDAVADLSYLDPLPATATPSH